jgi:predicted methyltransferase
LPESREPAILRRMSSLPRVIRITAPIGLLLVAACKGDGATAAPAAADPAAVEASRGLDEGSADDDAERLAAILAMPHRSDENKARDSQRHPAETLAFFGVQPGHTVVELWPGGGWYTEILGPYVKDAGQLIVTVFDREGPEEYYGTRQARAMIERFETQAEVYGSAKTVTIPAKVEIADGKVKNVAIEPFELAPPASVDVVLTFRNSHGWYRNDQQELIYGAAFEALAPGGVFGVVQHRAPEGANPDEWAPKGYLPEQTVIDAAQAVGFELVERSEINANPNDTKDHPDGVWNLPPTLGGKDADQDKYRAIGESDRMTLKFVKPE